MKPLLFILLLWILPGVLHAQSSSIAATIAFTDPSPSCGLYGEDDLSFGTIRVPGSGTLSVTINAATGRVTTVPAGYSVSGASVGDFYISGSHVSSYSIRMNTQSLPTVLRSNSGDTIPLAGATVRSTNGTTWTSTASGGGVFDSGSAGGLFTSITRYYQIGGTISGIRLTTPRATYSATITLSLTCT